MSERDPLEMMEIVDNPTPLKAPAPLAKDKKYTIIIDEVEGLPGYEFVGVNGDGFQIQRGIPVEVPAKVVEALRNAVTTAYRKVPHPNEQGRMQLIPYQRATIPWRFA